MNGLKYYRGKIDDIDKKIVKLLTSRLNLVRGISKFKKANKIKVVDKKRESQVIGNIKKLSNKKHQKFVIDVYKKIINYSERLQK